MNGSSISPAAEVKTASYAEALQRVDENTDSSITAAARSAIDFFIK